MAGMRRMIGYVGSDDDIPCPRHMCGIAEDYQSMLAKALSAAPEVPPQQVEVLSGHPQVHLFQPVRIDYIATNCKVTIQYLHKRVYQYAAAN